MEGPSRDLVRGALAQAIALDSVRLAQLSSEQLFMHSKAKFDIVFVRHVIIDTRQNKVNCLYK